MNFIIIDTMRYYSVQLFERDKYCNWSPDVFDDLASDGLSYYDTYDGALIMTQKQLVGELDWWREEIRKANRIPEYQGDGICTNFSREDLRNGCRWGLSVDYKPLSDKLDADEIAHVWLHHNPDPDNILGRYRLTYYRKDDEVNVWIRAKNASEAIQKYCDRFDWRADVHTIDADTRGLECAEARPDYDWYSGYRPPFSSMIAVLDLK